MRDPLDREREPWTCRSCWENHGKNVKLRDLPTEFDNRSVEAIVRAECSEKCGFEVRFKL